VQVHAPDPILVEDQEVVLVVEDELDGIGERGGRDRAAVAGALARQGEHYPLVAVVRVDHHEAPVPVTEEDVPSVGDCERAGIAIAVRSGIASEPGCSRVGVAAWIGHPRQEPHAR